MQVPFFCPQQQRDGVTPAGRGLRLQPACAPPKPVKPAGAAAVDLDCGSTLSPPVTLSVLCLTQKHLSKQAVIYDSSERCNLRFSGIRRRGGRRKTERRRRSGRAGAVKPAVIIFSVSCCREGGGGTVSDAPLSRRYVTHLVSGETRRRQLVKICRWRELAGRLSGRHPHFGRPSRCPQPRGRRHGYSCN